MPAVRRLPLAMSSAVHNLQKAIVAGNQSLTQLLRQTKLIAAKLGVEDVERWVDSELQGYSKDTDPPEYRKVFTAGLEIHNAYRGGWQFAGNLNIAVKVRSPISEIEGFSGGDRVRFAVQKNFPIESDDGSSFAADWPQRFYVAGSQYKRVIDAVMNELLRWTTELDKRGIKGEDMDFDEKEKKTAGKMVFNIGTVQGMVGNVTSSQVTVHDYSSLHQLLIDHKIPKQERRELEDIMDELKETPHDKRPSLLARAEKWIVKHKGALGAGAEIIGKAIKAETAPPP